MDHPSIKGSSISGLIEDLGKLVDRGAVPTALLMERLTEQDRALLRMPVNPAGWYDIHSYRRLTELICEIEGRRDDLLRERGAAATRRLAAAGLYQQMESVTRLRETQKLDPEARFAAYGRGLRLITTLSRSILNFSRWEVCVDPDSPDRYRIDVHEAGDFPDVLAFTSEGFINGMANLGRDPGAQQISAWNHERLKRHLLVFRMASPV